MTQLKAQYGNTLLSRTLGALIATSLIGSAEASWSSLRCGTQCSKTIVGKNKSALNNCAENCDNTKIIELLMDNRQALTVLHQISALKAQKIIKMKEQKDIEEKLHAENKKKKPNEAQTKYLVGKKGLLMTQINALTTNIESLEGASASPRPTSEAEEEMKKALENVPSEAQIARKTQAATDQPPSGLPPMLPDEEASDIPTDLPPMPPSTSAASTQTQHLHD